MKTSRARLVLVLALAAWLGGCYGNDRSLALTAPVSSVAGGYPLALHWQSDAAPGTYLSSVLVVVERKGQRFTVSKITYGFGGLWAGGRVFSVTMDNAAHRAFATNEVQSATAGGFGPEMLPLVLDGKDVPEVLDIALANGLGVFCAAVPEQSENILLQLASAEKDNSPTWHITADGWDAQGAIAQLRMDIDAGSGQVRNHSFRKAPNRP